MFNLEGYIDSRYISATLWIGCIVYARSHRIPLTTCINLGVIARIIGEAQQVIACEIEANSLQEDSLHKALWQSVTNGNIL